MPADVEGRFFWLLDRIVRREGIGDVLADGVYWAARRIGKGAEKFGSQHHQEARAAAAQARHAESGLLPDVRDRRENQYHPDRGQFPQAPFPTMEEREAFVKDWFQVPDDKFKRYLLGVGAARREIESALPVGRSQLRCRGLAGKMHYIDDALGTCAGLSSFPLKPPYHIHNFPKFISAGTGIEFDRPACGRRPRAPHPAARDQRQAGHAPRRRQAAGGPLEEALPDLEKTLLDAYYELKGWNANGIPTRSRCWTWAWPASPRTWSNGGS